MGFDANAIQYGDYTGITDQSGTKNSVPNARNRRKVKAFGMSPPPCMSGPSVEIVTLLIIPEIELIRMTGVHPGVEELSHRLIS